MNHATAFKQTRNPSSDDDARSSAIEHAQDALARPESDNDEEPPSSSNFFRHLASHSQAAGSNGQSWRVGRFDSPFSAERMARVDCAVAGLEGVLAVIHAADLAAAAGEAEPAINPYLLDRLMQAARGLTDQARCAIEDLRELSRRDH